MDDENREKLTKWLQKRNCGHYLECFLRAGADLSLLPCLTDGDLKEMGVKTLGARKKILIGVYDEFMRSQEESSLESKEKLLKDWNNRPQKADHARATHGTILSFLCEGSALVQQVKAHSKNPSDSKENQNPSKTGRHEHRKANFAQKRRFTSGTGKQMPFRMWERIAGTKFIVDRFHNLPSSSLEGMHWFLTHFHADHYRGLTSKFNRGYIYCTPITGNLIQQQLRVNANLIQQVNLNETIVIDDVSITFLDANHCPGAAMLLFETPGQVATLHTGDARLTSEMNLLPKLQDLRGNVNLVLDTTYADPKYTFPSQDETLKFVIDAVKAETFVGDETLFMFGSYTIGKERVYLEAAKALNTKVYVSKTKKKILDCLQLQPEEASLLTTDDLETNLHAVPLWMISEKHMSNALKHYRGRYKNVVGFQPTGWAHAKLKSKSKGISRKRKKGTIIIYSVPYSEHSSFEEMKKFVAWLMPRAIIPSVNNDGGPNLQRMLTILRN